jgi:branched-chain amino acid transport system substrate-binding protein
MGAAALGLAGRPRPGRAAERGPIRIGSFGPLTGNFSQTGKDMTDGFNLFWEEVGHKVAGREVRVIVADYLKTPPYDRNYPPCAFCE